MGQDIKGMVDVTKKPVTLREAVAQAHICLRPETIRLIRNNKIPKGDVLTLAKCAGILAAKRCDELIPFCHTLPLEHIGISFLFGKSGITIITRCRAKARTGVEMEAMAASSVAALTIYDMCKSIDRGAVIDHIKLMEKRGGRSGHYKRK